MTSSPPSTLPLFAAGRIAGSVGSQLAAFMLPAIAVLSAGGGPLLTATLAIVQWGAFPLLAIPFGALVDRYARLRVKLGVGSDILQAVAVLSLPIALLLGHLWEVHLVVIAALVGAAAVLFDLSIMAAVNEQYEGATADKANSYTSMARNVGLLVGPVAGGTLVQLVGPTAAMSSAAACFFLSAVGITLSLGRKRQQSTTTGLSSNPATTGALAGLKFLRTQPTLLAFAVFSGCLNLGMQWIQANYYVFAYRELGASPLGVGICFAVGAAFGIWAALSAPKIIARWGLYTPMAISGVLTLLGWAALLLAVPFLYLGLALSSVLVSLSLPVVFVAQAAARRELAPSELQGRIYAAMTLVAFITVPLGYLAGGLIGEFISVMAALYSGLAVIALGLLAGLVAINRARNLANLGLTAEPADASSKTNV